jgi:hypothetical protein
VAAPPRGSEDAEGAKGTDGEGCSGGGSAGSRRCGAPRELDGAFAPLGRLRASADNDDNDAVVAGAGTIAVDVADGLGR